jgi:hypothetical protein
VILNERQAVDAAARLAASYLAGGGPLEPLLTAIAAVLLRENRDFHTIQMVEAAARQTDALSDWPEARRHVVTAALRYLAAHSPTMRSQEQTWRIALRLHRGEHVFESDQPA